MRMELGGERSVGSIDQEQKAVNSVDVNDKKQTENDKLNKSVEGSENEEKGVDYKVKEGQDKELKANSDSKENKENSDKETEKPNVKNKDNYQETREKTKKTEYGVKNEAVNEEEKAKVRVAGHVKGPGKAKRKTVKMDDSFEEPDRYATPREVNMNQ